MERNLKKYILKDLPSKIVLVTGPRQCGKTTMAKQLYKSEIDYLNYDSEEDRLILQKKSWNRKSKLIIFDELHKKREWKRWLKGIYDTEGIPPEILVTGSAKLDTYRKVGDSLAGRYFQFRLHPLDLKEINQQLNFPIEEAFDRLWECSGFPEPFLSADPNFYRRWRRSHLDIILRQDLIDIYAVRDIQSIETLVALLKDRVGSTVSYANLARDLERDAKTIKRWLELLENLYIIFKVSPYHKNVARSLLKEPKYYFYDHTYADDVSGARLENLVACSINKELNFLEDTAGIHAKLHFLRTRDGKEIDFLVCLDEKPSHLIEVKVSNSEPTKAFEHFSKIFPEAKKVQLVKNLKREQTYPNKLEIRSVLSWLKEINLAE